MNFLKKGTCFVSCVKCIDCSRTIFEGEKEYYLSICEKCWRHKIKIMNIIIKQLLPKHEYQNEDEYEDEDDDDDDDQDEDEDDDDEDQPLRNTGRGLICHKTCSKCGCRIDSNNYIKHRTICKKCHNQNRSKYR